jgi:hypothetical protein
MKKQRPPRESYAKHLAHLAQSMAAAEDEAIAGDLEAGTPALHLQLFIEGNFDKRANILRKQLALLQGAFDDFDELIEEYLLAQPQGAFDTGTDDSERFLRFLGRRLRLTAEQRDYVACQRVRHAVEERARLDRQGHLRFQELWSLAPRLSAELDTNPGLRIHLNPIRVWSRFRTSVLLDAATRPPAHVLFFAVRRDMTTAVFEAPARALVQELAALAPCTLEHWASRSRQGDRATLAELCRNLAVMGLVAFG